MAATKQHRLERDPRRDLAPVPALPAQLLYVACAGCSAPRPPRLRLTLHPTLFNLRARAALVLVLLLTAAGARADDRVGASVFVHSDDDGLLVVHPVATAVVAVQEETHVSARYDADVVSAATVDVRTSASPHGFDETRHGGGLGVTHDLTRTLHLGLGYGISYSPDYMTHSGAASLSVEDDQRIHTVGLSLAAAYDSVGRTGEIDWVGHVTNLASELSWTAVLSPVAVMDLVGALEWKDGYQENPYRYVPIESGSGQSVVYVTEEVPDQRLRGALRGRLRLAPEDWLFLRGSYRFHMDDWGVAGHTVRARVAAEASDRWLLSLNGRFYSQRAASFYQGTYSTLPYIPDIRTKDRELAHSWYLAGGARVEYEMGGWLGFAWRVDLRGEVKWQRYFDTPVLPQRTSVTVGFGLSIER